MLLFKIIIITLREKKKNKTITISAGSMFSNMLRKNTESDVS